MPDLTPAQRTKLVGILSRLGSDFDSERATAGLLASSMLAAADITWSDLLESNRRRLDQTVLPAGYSTRTRYTPPTPNADLILCMRHMPSLRPWEQNFALSLSSTLKWSPKQRSILADSAEKLQARGLG